MCYVHCIVHPHLFVSFLHNNQYMVHVYGKYILNLDCILQSIMILFFVRYLPINSIYHIWRLLVAWPGGGGGGGGAPTYLPYNRGCHRTTRGKAVMRSAFLTSAKFN